MHWNPLFSYLLTSSLLAEGPDVVAAHYLLLASSDQFGESDLTAPAVASLLRIETARAAKAFEVLAAPDPHSRTKEFEGARIVPLPDGRWFLPSHAKYRTLMSKESAAARQRRHRAKAKGEPQVCAEPGCKGPALHLRSLCKVHEPEDAH